MAEMTDTPLRISTSYDLMHQILSATGSKVTQILDKIKMPSETY
jgi:hypothetical protein